MISLMKTFKLKSMFQFKDRIKLKILKNQIFPLDLLVDRIPSSSTKMKIFKICLNLLTKRRILVATVLIMILRAIKTFQRLVYLILFKIIKAKIHIRKLLKLKKKIILKIKTYKLLKTSMVLRTCKVKMQVEILKKNKLKLNLIKIRKKKFQSPKEIKIQKKLMIIQVMISAAKNPNIVMTTKLIQNHLVSLMKILKIKMKTTSNLSITLGVLNTNTIKMKIEFQNKFLKIKIKQIKR